MAATATGVKEQGGTQPVRARTIPDHEMPKLRRIRQRLVAVGIGALAMVALAVAASVFELANEREVRHQYEDSLAITHLAFDAESLVSRMRALEELITQQETGPRNAATVATLQGARRALERDFTEWARRTGEVEQRNVSALTREHLVRLQAAVSGLRTTLGWTEETATAPAAPVDAVDRAYLAAIEASQATVLSSVRGGADRAVLRGYTAGDLAAALVIGASALALVLGGAVIALLNQAQHENRAALGIMGELLRTDPLTGVTNRRGLDENLPVEMSRAKRGTLPLTVAMLDLDFFKRYNSRRGHAGGDSLLRTAAQSWRRQLRPTDTLVRYGGEEFTLVLPSCDSDQACQLIARLRPLMPDNQTFSAGVATWDFRESGDELLRRADHALLLAKKNGRNRTMVSGQEDQISLPLAAK